MNRPRQLTVLFVPESAYGPTNQCIGLGDILRRRGHRVVFAAEASWRGKLAALGFEEDLVDLAPPDQTELDAGQFWKDFIRETSPEFRNPTVDQLASFMVPTWQALVDGAKYCEPQLKGVIARAGPDVIVEDNVIAFPALLTADAPFVRIVSCNPLEIRGPQIPPTYSGLPSDDSSQWAAFHAEYDRTHRPLWEGFNAWVVEQGAVPLPDLEFIPPSEHANLYVYPDEVDYTGVRPLDATWHRMDSSVRETDDDYELPDRVRDRPDGTALVYLSLGSLGSADVELMKRLVDVLGRTTHRYIVSKGPQQAEFDLADNMVGAEFLPQTTVIAQVDAVITHGGNNTTTECLHFGKPMILLPLFWDQYDNAQRMDETGFGVRLPTYTFSEEQLRAALARVLDVDVRGKAERVGAQIRTRDGLRRGAHVIEQIARARAGG
ncbi:MAG TPA: nucleotide disphospho-sugar-binding domain-containing protein [Jatrophihabitans sp.]|jgi:MGT family glycosyltransferase